MKKIIEKHITIEESIFNKLKIMAKKEQRTMRAIVHRLISDAFDKNKEL